MSALSGPSLHIKDSDPRECHAELLSDDKPSTASPPVDTGGGGSGGGGTGGGDTGGGGTPGAMAEGFFVDAAVAGLNYTTSSGITSITDATGRYEYREGDTVTFSIGGLTNLVTTTIDLREFDIP